MGKTLAGFSEVRARRRLMWLAVVLVWAVLFAALLGFDADILTLLPLRT